jgi:hypothetical protein
LFWSFIIKFLHKIKEPAITNITPKYCFNDVNTIENTEFIEISNKVQLTIKDVTIPIIDPTMLEKIRLKVDEKYLIVFIQFLIKKLKINV